MQPPPPPPRQANLMFTPLLSLYPKSLGFAEPSFA